MRTVSLSVVVAALMAGSAHAASVVTYELQLGGNNHVAAVKAGGRPTYTPGNPADNQVFPAGSVVNWAATVSVTGNHTQPGHPSDGLPTQGMANIVINLELRQGNLNGPLVGDFFSNIHDGAGALPCTQCAGGGGVCAGAAFALAWFLPGIPWPAARVTEAIASGQYAGPYMEICMWPTVRPGRLLGTGAAYAQWCRGCGLGSTTTRGVGIPTAQGGLGFGPVMEGQIDTTGLSPGTYVLRLTPGPGTNVLRGDVNLVSAPPPGSPQVATIAVAANQLVGDTITFVLASSCTAPQIVSAVSRKVHNGVNYDVNINTAGAVENRAGGLSRVVVNFDQDVAGLGGLDPSDVQTMLSTVDSVAINGSVLTIDLSGSLNQNPEYLGFSGIVPAAAGCNDVVTQTLCVNILRGDINGDRSTNLFDVIAARNAFGQPLSTSNFRNDINLDGVINILDIISVRNELNKNMVSVCP